MCTAEVILKTFTRYSDEVQLEVYTNQVAMATLQPGECLIECPHCTYSEILAECSNENVALVYCKGKDCGLVTCNVCKLQIGKLRWKGVGRIF